MSVGAVAAKLQGYDDTVSALALSRLRLLCMTFGGLSLVFGFYEFTDNRKVFDQTLTERIVFVCVCAALIAFAWFQSHRAKEAERASGLAWAFPLSLLFVASMLWMMEAIVAASGAGGAFYPFTGLVLLGPAAALIIPFRTRQCVAMACIITGGHALALAIEGRPERIALLPIESMILVASGVIAVIATLVTERLRRANFQAQAELEIERHRSHELLYTVMPRVVADRLIELGWEDPEGAWVFDTFSDHFDTVSVLFADIVGFTPLSSQLAPSELLHAISDVFLAFDKMVVDLGVQKIKTIGDAYMAAAGVPEPRSDHAVAITELAMRMREYAHGLVLADEHRIGIRIGIHTGPAVAGVIGSTCFTYDIWGDTVNVAARMESHSNEGEIQITEATASRIREYLVVEDRGMIEIKGKGPMKTWFVKARKPPGKARRPSHAGRAPSSADV